MAKRNPLYDFKWCPGCGDFGVKVALEQALAGRMAEKNQSIENTVVVAGIGCSGNMVHMMEGPQPFGIHGIHGRALPIAYGIKSARPDLNVVVVCGDGDFLSIGNEHIAPQARRNLDITAVIMDNGIYGLTKGQASPTTELNVVTSTTRWGKLEEKMNPFLFYLGAGVPYITSQMSSRVKELAGDIRAAMDYPGFSIVHVQSPCTTYNDTYSLLKGDEKKGIEPLAFPIEDSHDVTDITAAADLVRGRRIPIGLLYKKAGESVPLHQRLAEAKAKGNIEQASVEKLLQSMVIA
ncbi:MAG: 2-oxoacid:ferredoxin oxidoreductase subunit beta [Dehalococcoidia bacterium]|nr:2-oxoacid:ferredoxin oxidoreductase subunit beta [Dehalococcoidia bacterium]MCA9850907.1 2-oxoacid:ferredoxin oxidoreductase subunit beta [Dehalococcoidia bacterium]MCA9856881.1 2-oxoacid:ferredoxin oxidoreductase subunit beta [Dehalococcoidia bacterium]MCB9484020.1 2-oxoacid:ferredoxin oxidoreductase subunit beta [Dehalococcoidia bacterium]MCB9490479.1 2-oxoacid:ferredoxin oxidoreductase subunit beta [Dehalococcoidia bacterium]